MASSSSIYTSPSFNRNHSNDIADIADRVVQELLAENRLEYDDVFSFSDDDIPPEIGAGEEASASNYTEIVKQSEEGVREDDECEFAFPVVCGDSNSGNSSPVSDNDVISDDQISLRFPLFDKSLISSEVDLSFSNGVDSKPTDVISDDHISLRYPLFDKSLISSEVDRNLSNGVDFPATKSKPAPRTRPSLRELLSEERDSPSTSSSSSDDLDGIPPGTYCVWKPKAETKTRGKHKKSNSICTGNTSKRWKLRDLLKRTNSDDIYSTGKDSPVTVFIPPVSPDQKTNNQKMMNTIDETTGGVGVASAKSEKKIPAYKSKVGNIRLPGYLPYRQDQVAAFGSVNGQNTNFYRY
ncbi:hypothetical protein SSX86_031404 [Deinandra increscens subsp. villosa]|uniref:Uncharacterized protein n=1 Tax=Deinandra increscens subsp. villosa TaxID=3103831 RepID=A0AAP0C9Y6_9ASTR